MSDSVEARNPSTRASEGLSETTPCYYTSRDRETRGPTTVLALKALLKAGVPDVNSQTLVFVNGAEAWEPLSDVLSRLEPVTNQDALNEPVEPAQAAVSRQPKLEKAQALKPRSPERTSIYIQGLPLNVTQSEVVEFFSKCGIIKTDDDRPRVKIYRDHATNEPKGDALVTFLLPDSVALAIDMYHGVDFRDGFKLSITEAEFPAEPSNMESKPVAERKRLPKNEKLARAKKVRHLQERALLSWNEDSFATRETALLIVVLKHMFDPETLQAGGEPALKELEADLVEGLSDFCPSGDEIRKVTVFKSHPEGVIVVRFKDALLAADCVKAMNGRYYDGRQVKAALWDGVTEYAPKDDAEARAARDRERMEAFDEWIEGEDGNEVGESQVIDA